MLEPIERVRALMTAQGYDAMLFKTRANFAWLTGGQDNHIVTTSEYGVANLVVLPERIVCVTNSIEARRITEEELHSFPCDIVAPDWTQQGDTALSELLSGKRVGVDCSDASGENVAQSLSLLRRTLTPAQQNQYRAVARIAAEAIEQVARDIQPGWTEHEIAAKLASAVMRQGCAPMVTLVSTDERVFNYRHPIPTAKRLDRYAMLVICAEKYGLVANATRFVHFGPLPQNIADNRFQCASIDVQMNAATRPGRRVSEVFQTAIDAYREVGYPDDWRLLHQGGPTGYASREYLATLAADDIIETGQAYAWNPAIRGIKSEDTMLVGETDNEFLTHTGNWPYIQVEFHGRTYERPDILIRTV